jgi:uncharacterized repeat protein (TIGR03803 family)
MVSGNTIFGTTQQGGSGYGTVFRVNIDGTFFTNLYSFSSTEGAYPISDLVLSGNVLYGTREGGGTHVVGTVFRINSNGSAFTNLFNFNSGIGANPFAGLTLVGSTFYGTTYGGHGALISLKASGSGFTNFWWVTTAAAFSLHCYPWQIASSGDWSLAFQFMPSNGDFYLCRLTIRRRVMFSQTSLATLPICR